MARSFALASSQYLAASSAVITSLPCTIAGWSYIASDANNSTLLSVSNSASTSEYFSIGAGFDRVGNTAYCMCANSVYGIADSASGMSLSQWHHVCGVFAGTTSRSVYLDGGSKGSDTTSVADPGGSCDRSAIGVAYDSSPSDYCDGRIGEVGVWDVALGDVEVAALAAGYSPLCVRPASLLEYWPLLRDDDEGIVGGLSLTASNAPTIAAHPRIIYPSRQQIITAPTASGVSIPVLAANHYRRMRA